MHPTDSTTALAAPQPWTPDQFAAQFEQAYPYLWLVAAGFTVDRASAEDLVQEAAVVALEKLGAFTPGTNFRAWMAQIVRLRAMNQNRKAVRQRTSPVDPVALDRQQVERKSPESTPVTADRLVNDVESQFDDRLLAALQTVAEIPRACLLLRCVADLSYQEISTMMESPEGTAMSHVHRAKQKLRNLLRHDETVPQPGGE